MPSVYRTKDRQGNFHPNWRIRFTNWKGERDGCVGLPSKNDTLKLAWKIQAEHDEIRKGLRPPPKPSDMPRSFREVADEYLAWGKSQGGHGNRPWSKTHYRLRRSNLAFWEQKLEVRMMSDLLGCLPQVEKILRELQVVGRAGKPCSGKTLQNIAETIAAFCDWAVRREYLADDPLKHLSGWDTSPTFTRRALTQDEVTRLLAVSPAKRRVVYVLAMITGLRAGELRQLLVSDFEPERGWLKLRKVFTKNGKEGYQPLHASTVRDLLEVVVGKQPTDRLLFVPTHSSDMLYEDMARAGIPVWTAEGKMDFHSLRTSFATFIVESGANVKELQTLLRHSTPDLSMRLYARYREHPLQGVVSAVGDRLLTPSQTGVKQDAGEKLDPATNTVEQRDSVEQKAPQAEGSNPTQVPAANWTAEGQDRTQTKSESDFVSEQHGDQGTEPATSRPASGHLGCQTGVKRPLPPELSHLADVWDTLPPSAQDWMLTQVYRSTNMGSGFSGFSSVAPSQGIGLGFSGFSGVAA